MALAGGDIEGQWFGMILHQPSRGVIHVSFHGSGSSLKGTWKIPSISRGAGKKGAFTATRCANLLNVRVTTRPLVNVQFQLTILEENDEAMIVGVIPLRGVKIPFATVTLFRDEPAESEMDGICPIIEFVPKGRQ